MHRFQGGGGFYKICLQCRYILVYFVTIFEQIFLHIVFMGAAHSTPFFIPDRVKLQSKHMLPFQHNVVAHQNLP
jgi:hypothetical protein